MSNNKETINKSINAEVEDIDELELQWKNMGLSILTFKSQLTALHQQLRTLEKATKRKFKQLKKEVSKNNNRGNHAPSGFAKPSKISKELCLFMGKKEGTEVARTEVTKFIITYIKDNNLAESRDITPDEKLAVLLGTGVNDKVTYFNLQKYMNKHFSKLTEKKK